MFGIIFYKIALSDVPKHNPYFIVQYIPTWAEPGLYWLNAEKEES